MTSEAITADLLKRLHERATVATQQWWTNYLKGNASFIGVPMAGVRSSVNQVLDEYGLRSRAGPKLPAQEALALALSWMQLADTEPKLAGMLLLAEHTQKFDLADGDALLEPLSQGLLTDWNTCDWYAIRVLHRYVTVDDRANESRSQQLRSWVMSASGQRPDAMWLRRAATVAFVKTAPRGEENFTGYTDVVLAQAAANLCSQNRFAHTGPGWLLRELSRAEPEQVRGFVAANPSLSAEAKRMAMAHLRPGPYRRR